MKPMFKQTISAFFALMAILSFMLCAVSCADSTDTIGETAEQTNDGNTGIQSSDITPEETERPVAYETLKKEKFNREFVICARKDHIDDFEIEEGYTGSVLNDSIVERNLVVSEDFGIDIRCVVKNDDHLAPSHELVTQSISGIDDYAMYIGHKDSFTLCAQSGYCYDLSSIEALDLTSPWWDAGCYDNLSVNGKTFMMTGDINPVTMRYRSCMVFNKNLMANLTMSVDELNSLAQNGKWTLDALYDYTANVTHDLNGDGTVSYLDDQYGLVGWRTALPYNLYYGSGKPFVTVVDGTPELTYSTGSEKVIDIYDKIYKIVYDQNAYFVTDPGLYSSYFDVFRDGRALFCDTALYDFSITVANVGMDDGYGILPTPKYDQAQENYQSFVNGAASFVMIANSSEAPEFVGTIMEAMATYNYDNITPNMYEIVTKLQMAQDPTSAQMVDTILRTAIFDMAYYGNLGMPDVVCDGLMNKSESIASALKAANTKASQRQLPELLEAFDKIK